jgi:hypothetical protein
MSNVYDIIGTAQASKGGTHIRDGKYTFAVEKIGIHTGGQNSEVFFIAELRVLESAKVFVDPAMLAEDEGQPEPNAVGTTASVVCNLTKHASAKGNAKAFLVGVYGGLGYTEDQVTPQLTQIACGDAQPLRGAIVKDETFRKAIRTGANAGKPITLHRWSPQLQTAEEIKAVRAYLDQHGQKEAPALAPAPAAQPAPVVTAASAPVVEAPAPAPAAPVGGLLASLGIK